MIELGIMPSGTQLAERMWFIPDPIVLAPATRAILGKKMELYAGMVENLDFHVGRLIEHLKKIGSTRIRSSLCSATTVRREATLQDDRRLARHAELPLCGDELVADPSNAWGDPGSYVSYGPMWAQVSMTPFSQYKGWTAEGGIHNALIVSGPAVKRPKGSINHGLMHVAT